MKVSIHPKGRRVLVYPDPIEEVSAGGIVIAQDKKLERAAVMKGTLVSIGHLCWMDFTDDSPWADVGDWVMFAPYAGQRIKDPTTNELYIVMNDEDIIGTIDRDQKDGE